MKRPSYTAVITILLVLVVAWVLLLRPFSYRRGSGETTGSSGTRQVIWTPPDTSSIPPGAEGQLIRYGRELVIHTASYFGPRGKILRITNGMNCQNCHIDGGTRLMGNNFCMVAATYPKYRARSNRFESIAYRVNECMERSLNGRPLDSASREMKAFVAYLKWVGKDVHPREEVFGTGIEKVAFLDRAADTTGGRRVFITKCMTCHGEDGQGLLNADSVEYVYPPLWGPHSYNVGAGLYRLSSFAGYVKNNMPFGTTYHAPQLSNEEAWDVAAYVNSKPHPSVDISKDWPSVSSKPFDAPFGPYADTFSEARHKYGPFNMMQKNPVSRK